MTECLGQHWGEIPALPAIESGIAAVERKELMTIQPIDLKSIQIQCPANENRNTTEDESDDFEIRDIPIGNPIMLHTIKLLQFSRQLNDNNVRQKLNRESVPQLIETNEMHSKELNVFSIRGRNLSQKVIKKLLRRTVVIISVFNGYEITNESVIDLLADILSEYLSRLCQTIRTTTDSLELMSSNDFIDVIDRVFHDINVPDFESLRQYDSDLRLYNQNLIKEVNKKIGINDTIGNQMNSSNKIRNNFQIDSNCDNCTQPSASVEPEVKVEPTLSLKSLLSSFKTNNTEETEQLFDLTSLPNNSSNKSNEN